MNNFYYEGLAREVCIHSGSSMLGVLISSEMPPPFSDDLEEANMRRGRGGRGGIDE